MLLTACHLRRSSALLVTHNQNTSRVNVNWPYCGITHVFPADYKHQGWIIWGFVSKRVFLGWRILLSHSFLFSLNLLLKEWRSLVSFSSWPPTQYYQQSGDSTQEINSRALMITHKRPFTPMYLGHSDLETAQNPGEAVWMKTSLSCSRTVRPFKAPPRSYSWFM